MAILCSPLGRTEWGRELSNRHSLKGGTEPNSSRYCAEVLHFPELLTVFGESRFPLLVGVQVKSHILLLKPDLSELWEMLVGGANGQKSRTLTVSGPLIVALGLKMLF